MSTHRIHIAGRTIHRGKGLGGGSVLLNAEGTGNVGCGFINQEDFLNKQLFKKNNPDKITPLSINGGVLGNANLGEKLEKLMVKPLISKKPPNISF